MARGYTPFFAFEKRKNTAECIFSIALYPLLRRGYRSFFLVLLWLNVQVYFLAGFGHFCGVAIMVIGIRSVVTKPETREECGA